MNTTCNNVNTEYSSSHSLYTSKPVVKFTLFYLFTYLFIHYIESTGGASPIPDGKQECKYFYRRVLW